MLRTMLDYDTAYELVKVRSRELGILYGAEIVARYGIATHPAIATLFREGYSLNDKLICSTLPGPDELEYEREVANGIDLNRPLDDGEESLYNVYLRTMIEAARNYVLVEARERVTA